jgi:hypothetical protein
MAKFRVHEIAAMMARDGRFLGGSWLNAFSILILSLSKGFGPGPRSGAARRAPA